LSSAASAGIYYYVFDASPVRGALVGAQIGTSLTYAYALGSWKGVAKTSGKGVEVAFNKLMGKAISLAVAGTFASWTRTAIAQDFYEGFAAGVFNNTYGQFVDQFTDIGDDPLEVILSSLTLTLASATAFAIPDMAAGRKTVPQFLHDITHNTIPAFMQGQVFDQALNDLTPVPAVKAAVKAALIACYTTGLSSLVEILNFDGGR
jgi:hypothetical protein